MASPAKRAVDEVAADRVARQEAAREKLGRVSNFLQVASRSAAALEGHLRLTESLTRGTLSPAMRARIAVAVSEFNGCDYSLSAQIHAARTVAKLDDAEITANRNGASNDLVADAAVKFAISVVRDRGEVSPEQLTTVKAAGYDEAQIVEIVQHVAAVIFSNYLNKVARTEIDFPLVKARRPV